MEKKIIRFTLHLSVALSAIALSLTFLYIWFVYSSIPFISYWRTIWIETAMTTGDHQWLATSFIPADIIEGVVNNSSGNKNVVGGLDFLQETIKKPSSGTSGNDGGKGTVLDDKTSQNDDESTFGNSTGDDILGQKSLVVGQKDYAGYTVLINDIEQGLFVSEITGNGFKGRIMLIDDPTRVYVGSTTMKNVQGLRIKQMLTTYDAVAGINASGFADPNGEGYGGEIIGLSCSGGEYWGDYVSYYGSVVLTKNNKLVVGNISSVWSKYNIRDGIQFGPVLVADGEAQVTGSAGYGIQPRTAIGQREDGVIVFLCIDGRNVTHSIGCTVGDMAKIMLQYGVINAACCDGGSSTVMAYNGEILNKNCSLNPDFGRMLPNAFLVKKK